MSSNWSVWKHGGFANNNWVSVCNDEDEEHVYHVFRHYESIIKVGYLQLREDDTVIKERQFPRLTKRKIPELNNVEITEEKEALADYNFVQALELCEIIEPGIRQKWLNGYTSYTDHLSRAVSLLGDALIKNENNKAFQKILIEREKTRLRRETKSLKGISKKQKDLKIENEELKNKLKVYDSMIRYIELLEKEIEDIIWDQNLYRERLMILKEKSEYFH